MFEGFLKKNLDLKILSLSLAVLLWFYVHLTKIPIAVGKEATGLKVPLVADNLSPSLRVLSAPADVFVSVTQTPHSQPLKPSDFKASVDLESVKHAGAYSEVPVQIASPAGAVVTDVKPDKVEVVVDEEGEKTVPVTWVIEGGGQPQGTVFVSPPTAGVKGSKSAVEGVAAVQITLPENPNFVSNKFRGDLPAVPMDGQSKPVAGLSVIPQTAHVVIVRTENERPVSVHPVIVGSLAKDSQIASVTVAPWVVMAQAPAGGRLGGSLDTQPIDITGKSGTVMEKVNLVIPSGVKLQGSPEVMVMVQIESTAKPLVIKP